MDPVRKVDDVRVTNRNLGGRAVLVEGVYETDQRS